MNIAIALIVSALSLWVATALSVPPPPRFGNEPAEYAYSRLMGRCYAIRCAAVIMSYLAFFAAVIVVAANA